jgi:hypothetical protein
VKGVEYEVPEELGDWIEDVQEFLHETMKDTPHQWLVKEIGRLLNGKD